MNDLVIGRALRVLRHRRRLRQVDVARSAGVSQQLVSKIERGRLAGVSTRTIRLIFAVVDADVVTLVRWRAGELDRLLDEQHAAVVTKIANLLRRRGWEVLPEVTFSEFGERGSIDVLAWHAASKTLLVIEVKTEITSTEEILRRHDTKVRLAPKIGRDRFGTTPVRVGRLLVIEESNANRRRAERLDALLRPVYPARGRDVRTWLDAPDGNMAGLIFAAVPRATRTSPAGRVRVRATANGS
jgi:transcriptional regulator with XRE-family HTH domain